jgi:hypothetical protein
MSIDPAIVQRLSQSIAAALDQALAPLREEVAALRAELAAVRLGVAKSGGAAVAVRRDLAPPAASARRSTREQYCQVPGCRGAVLAKELCETHYRIMRRMAAAGERFDPAAQRPSGARTAGRGCDAARCDEPHYAKGLCRRHYMAARARSRAGRPEAPEETLESEPAGRVETETMPVQPAPAASADFEATVPFDWTSGDSSAAYAAGGVPELPGTSLPPKQSVLRIAKQQRGLFGNMAEKLGRNPQSVKDLLRRLGLAEEVGKIRAQEAEQIRGLDVRGRLKVVLNNAKALEDLEIVKEIDEKTRGEVLFYCYSVARASKTQDELLRRVASHFQLDDHEVRRLVRRYNLHYEMRKLRLGAPPRARARV